MRKCDFPTGLFVHEGRKDWTLQYKEDGSYIFYDNDQVDATGTYSIHNNLYTEDTEYPPCSHPRKATYTWAFDGHRLIFHLVGEDDCTARKQSLDGVTWVKQK
jgi:hypothetical protein